MKAAIDLDGESAEVSVDVATPTRRVETDRLLQRRWESDAARDLDEVDLTERVGTSFDVGHHGEQIGTVPDWARGENLLPEQGGGHQALLNRGNQKRTRDPCGWCPRRRVDKRACEPDSRWARRRIQK